MGYPSLISRKTTKLLFNISTLHKNSFTGVRTVQLSARIQIDRCTKAYHAMPHMGDHKPVSGHYLLIELPEWFL